ncbi:heme-binding protein [Mycolicibacterium moriokaense]|uniref:Hemophore-related protein n=1 Tax=Mycolicibacterium moriokaense TaxID=39691 RepID=A0A318H5B5_9MYCO|nr:heme-binding protein [Mycolicibacterium moriokaense]PXW99165.1 hemophore-related protein [Mycolicibacterium moriokaense]
MLLSASTARRAIGAGAVAGAMLFGTVPSALADPPPPPPPGCSAADLEQVRADASTATSGYLFTHPDVNAFFSSLKGQPKDQIRNQIKTYLANNPQTQSDLAGIRQPLHDMKNRCQ